ncbi:restriction endonuclease subunit S [Vibrio vulnificus]|nr:restriction endonuclease subunit S [Vibrio vulnificus]ELP6987703.1 restriction endonuclease subunit S [Vibrio vulnificus]ELT7700027.1 restriction endonuclease subunit S [Vibrio vulnificus]MCU8183085.1 restriction endonuclease subunit S [Vibrio vulnificus]HAS8431232.1 restriction endonuclease subunit S [Vibrio vulnificus]
MSFFQNHSSWPLVELKNIATLKRGYDLPTKLRVEGEVPIYAANGRNGTHDEVKIKGPGVITGRSGTIGKVHYTEDDYWPLNTALYVTNFHGNDPRWVYYMLSAFKLERYVEGAGVPTLNRNLVHDELIPLPPLDEQKRIAAILDKADAIRQKRKQAIALADEFLRSVFLEMFGDPVTNPKGWEVKEVSTVCTEIVDCVNRTAPTVDYETPYKMIRTTNVRDKKINLSETRYVEFETYKLWIRRLKPQKGDLIFTREAPAGEAGVIETDDFIFLGQRTMHFRPDQTLIHPVFLLHELTASGVKRQIVKLSAGSTVTHLSVPECKKFLIRVPSIAKQLPFVNLVRELDKKVNRSKESLLDSDSLFNALSQKAFSGQL